MKKKFFLAMLLGVFFMGTASAADITIYYSPYCPHCHHAQEFFSNKMIYEYPKLRVVQVNVMEEQNLPVFQEALSKCFQGYADFMEQELRDAVEVDLSNSDKETAAENKKALEADPDVFKSKHADRKNAIKEYVPNAQEEKIEKKNSGDTSSIYFYVLLIALVAILGFVLIRKDKKK